MLYKRWVEINPEILEIEGVTEERIVKDLICTLIRDIPYEQLVEVFNIKKISPKFPIPYERPKVNFLATIEIDITEEELEIKRELIKQLKNEYFR